MSMEEKEVVVCYACMALSTVNVSGGFTDGIFVTECACSEYMYTTCICIIKQYICTCTLHAYT